MSNDPVSAILLLILILVIVLTKGAITLALQGGTNPINFVDFVVGIVTLFAGANIAYLVGPYAAIFVVSCGGAILSLSGSDKDMSVRESVAYITVRVVVACCVTVALAELLQYLFPKMQPKYSLIPIAFGIGYIRDWAHLLLLKSRTIGFISSLRKKYP